MLESSENEAISRKIKQLRERALKKRKHYSVERLKKPVSSWISSDRLMDEIGKELTVILRTKGCNWALGESGGCSMCGYVQDACRESIEPSLIMNQFDNALESHLERIEADKENYVIKIFNSGSFFDDSEVAASVRTHIYEQIASVSKIKEVIFESRVEYIAEDKLMEMKDFLPTKYCEIGIGVESVNDYIRNVYINKGLDFKDFKNALNTCQAANVGVKAYLLLKPPFLNEQGAIDDCIYSIKSLINLKVNSISINPLNIQKGSLAEWLWFHNKYRPPWYYSLFKVLKKSLTKKSLESTRILSDPSGSGTKRGIHNCLKMECNEKMKEMLSEFVLSQDLERLKHAENECECRNEYQLKKDFH